MKKFTVAFALVLGALLGIIFVNLNQGNVYRHLENDGAAEKMETSENIKTAVIETDKYADVDYGIGFLHPSGWFCRTQETESHAQHETTCFMNPEDAENPLLAISVPYEGTVSFGTALFQADLPALQNYALTKTIYASDKTGSGTIEYAFKGSAGMGGFMMHASYGTGKPYATAEEAGKILDPVAQTVYVRLASG
jgi:hypothetical protein